MYEGDCPKVIKRLGHIDMRDGPRLGCASPKGHDN